MSERSYELVLLGATGYTGCLAAEYIQTHVDPGLKWAIAGRDGSRLHELAQKLKSIDTNRLQPVIEITSIENDRLLALAKKTKVLATTLGPYAKFGDAVVKACVEAGTHYLDVTGEITFTYDMMRKYHETAKEKGICLVPQCAIDSVPSDILAFLCAKATQDNTGVGLRECVASLQDIKGTLSGGTTVSLLGLFENYPSSYLQASLKPGALSTMAVPQLATPSARTASKSRHFTDLGPQTASVQAMTDIGLVYRSWSLFDNGAFYGPNFAFTPTMRASNRFTSVVIDCILTITFLCFNFSMFRGLLKKVAFKPGSGPDLTKAGSDVLSYKAIGVADDESARRSFATYRFDGSIYVMSGITLIEAALAVSRDENSLARKLGGMVTPATLGIEYVQGLQKAGIKIDWGMLD